MSRLFNTVILIKLIIVLIKRGCRRASQGSPFAQAQVVAKWTDQSWHYYVHA